MDIHEYTLWEVGYSGSLQDIANILEYPQEQVLFSGKCPRHIAFIVHYHLKMSNIHHILIKLENSYVLDK